MGQQSPQPDHGLGGPPGRGQPRGPRGHLAHGGRGQQDEVRCARRLRDVGQLRSDDRGWRRRRRVRLGVLLVGPARARDDGAAARRLRAAPHEAAPRQPGGAAQLHEAVPGPRVEALRRVQGRLLHQGQGRGGRHGPE